MSTVVDALLYIIVMYLSSSITQTGIHTFSLVPKASPEREHVYVGRAWYLFSCDHDVIKIRPEILEQKGKVLLMVYAIHVNC